MNKKPNIIYILADDMGYGDLSCFNENAAFKTPNFDRLAACGEAFTDAHASSAVCTPSRYSIMTGRYNWRSCLKWGVISGFADSILDHERMTVAEMLKANGYKTSAVGKWHMGMGFKKSEDFTLSEGFESCDGIDYSAKIENTPTAFGFDYYYGISGSLDMPPFIYIENDHFTAMPDHETVGYGKGFWRKGPTAPGFVHENVLPELTEKVMERMEYYTQNPEDPFFIYFPMPAPHTPILPTPEYHGKSGTNVYGDFVLEVDGMVGKIMDKAEELGIFDHTIFIYASDNGCSPRAGFQELLKCGHNPSYIFRGHKYHIYEGGHRIPLLVSWPEKIPAGKRCSQVVCLGDFMATMADLLGYQLPENAGVDSVSNLPVWLNSDAPEVRKDIIMQAWDGSLSIRRGNWKLEMCVGTGGETHPGPRDTYLSPNGELPAMERTETAPKEPCFQLYDLSTDIGEYVNVIHEHPDIYAELKADLKDYILKGRSTPGAPQTNTGEEVWDTIRWIEEEG